MSFIKAILVGHVINQGRKIYDKKMIITNCDSTTLAFDPRVSPEGVPL